MLRCIPLVAVVLSSIWASADSTPTVDCDADQSLNSTLAKVQKFTPATVKFKGTCTEYVSIDGFDNLPLTGLQGRYHSATCDQPSSQHVLCAGR